MYLVRIFAILLTLLPSAIFAYQVQPMISEINDIGRNTIVTFRVDNPLTTSLPIEVEVYKRTLSDTNVETLVAADDDFLILPPQAEVPANGLQMFRAKYLGDSPITQAQSYRVVFKQLPLNDQQQTNKVNVVFNLATLVFVSPQGAKGQLEHKLDCASENLCQLTVKNIGAGVSRLRDSTLILSNRQGERKSIDWQQVSKLVRFTYLAPEQAITLSLESLQMFPISNAQFKLVNE